MLYRPKRRGSLLIDLSPLIDVVFLLLIFFMVSTRFKDDHGLDLNLPKSQSRQKQESQQLTIYVDRNKMIRVEDKQVNMDNLKVEIQQGLNSLEDKMVLLKIDAEVDHGTVVAIMDAAKSAGASGLAFAADTKIK